MLSLLGPGLSPEGLNQRQRLGTLAGTRPPGEVLQELEPSLVAGGAPVALNPSSPRWGAYKPYEKWFRKREEQSRCQMGPSWMVQSEAETQVVQAKGSHQGCLGLKPEACRHQQHETICDRAGCVTNTGQVRVLVPRGLGRAARMDKASVLEGR